MINLLYGNKDVFECVLLSTCNRSELHVVLPEGALAYEKLIELFGLVAGIIIVDRASGFFLE